MRAALARHPEMPQPARKDVAAASRQSDPLPGLHRSIGNQGVLRLLDNRPGGQSLPRDLRGRFEPRFGQDLGEVRVHRDGPAARSARSMGALAYTVGNHIVFGEGQYQPGTNVGDRIMAHEITHALQQRRAALSADRTHVPFAAGSEQHEAEAHHVSRAVVLGHSAAVTSNAPLHVARLAPSGVGTTRPPVAPARSRDAAAMSIEELEQEIRLLEQWLLDSSESSTERVDVQIYLNVLRGNLAARTRVTAPERSWVNVLVDRELAEQLRRLDDSQAQFSQSLRNLAAGLPPAQFAQVDAAIGVVDAIIDTFQSIGMFLMGIQAGTVELVIDMIVGLAKLVLFVIELLGRFLSDLIAFLLQQVGVEIHNPGESGREFALKAWAALERMPASMRASFEAWQARYRAAPPELKAAMLGRLLPQVVATLFAGVGAARAAVTAGVGAARLTAAGGRALLNTSAGRAVIVGGYVSVARVQGGVLGPAGMVMEARAASSVGSAQSFVAPASTVPVAVATPVAAAAPLVAAEASAVAAPMAATAPLAVAEASAVAAPVAGAAALTQPQLMSLAYAASLAPTHMNVTAVPQPATQSVQPATTTQQPNVLAGQPAVTTGGPAVTTTAPVSTAGPAQTSVRIESTGARSTARSSSSAQAAIQAQAAMGFLDPALAAPGANVATATAQTPRSIVTAIRAQSAEVTAYDARLERGEIGLIAPVGSNIPGPDYVTAAGLPNGDYEIVVCDAKSRVGTGAFGEVGTTVPAAWQNQINDALSPGRLNLGNAALEQAVRDAWTQGRVRIARDTIDYSVQGQGQLRLDN